jgi:hypothetical protein
MKKNTIQINLSDMEKEAMQYRITSKLCNDLKLKNRMSPEQIFEHVTNSLDTLIYNDLVKRVAKINLNDATEVVFKKLIKIKNCNINEYYTDELPTLAYVGVDYLEDSLLLVDSDENAVKQLGVVLCEIELKGLHPKLNIKNQLQRNIRKFLNDNPIIECSSAEHLLRNQGEMIKLQVK